MSIQGHVGAGIRGLSIIACMVISVQIRWRVLKVAVKAVVVSTAMVELGHEGQQAQRRSFTILEEMRTGPHNG